jgi:hypothetical protein
MSIFPSEHRFYLETIRMYEYPTCEIPLLSHQNQTFRPSAATMLSLQENLEYPTPTAWAASRSDTTPNPQPSLPRGVHSSASGSSATPYALAQLSSSLPPSAPPLCGSPQRSKAATWSSHFVGRWDAISLSSKALGSVSDSGEILHRQDRCFSRSDTFPRQRRGLSMGASVCSHPTYGTNTNPSTCRRQLERHEENLQAERMDSSTLSLPFNSETPSAMETTTSSTQRRPCPRRTVSADSSYSRCTRRVDFATITGTFNTINSDELWHSKDSEYGALLSSIDEPLPNISSISRSQPAHYYERRRVHGLCYSQSLASQSFRI